MPNYKLNFALLLALAALAGCASRPVVTPAADSVATYRLELDAHKPIRIVAYGDQRFTDDTENAPSLASARRALVARIADDAPAAVFMTGDTPYHGGNIADYVVMKQETAAWRERSLPVFPELGNHEFYQCAEAECLDNWWNAFPDFRGRRWYSVAVGPHLLAIGLDSNAPLDLGSPQQIWLADQLARVGSAVDFVLIYLHHPPRADLQTGTMANHNPRPGDMAFAQYLEDVAAHAHQRFIVCGGHIHNYERREENGITYLVSGGGGAQPAEITRDAGDLYRGPGLPNYHYIRFVLDGARLRGEMIRLEDFSSAQPRVWLRRDEFEIRAKRKS